MPERNSRGINTPDTMGLTGRSRTLRRIALLKTEIAVVDMIEEIAAQAARDRIQMKIDNLRRR